MFLRPKESLRLSIYSIRFLRFSNGRDFHVTHCANLRSISAGRKKVVEVREKESSSVAGEFSVSVPPKKVNSNFFGIESEEGIIEINCKPSLNNDTTRQSFNYVEQEKFITTSFGTVRYDSENKPKQHGQLEKEKVLVSSNVSRDKIHELNQALLKENSVKDRSVPLGIEKCSKTTTDQLEMETNSKSKLASSSYVDEIYFPESYTKEENNFAKLEDSSSSANDIKSNFFEEPYFRDEMADESNVNFLNKTENISSIDKSHPFLFNESQIEFVNNKQSDFSSTDPKFSTEHLINAHEIKTNTKTLNNLIERIEEVNVDNNDEQLSLELNYPSLEDLGGNKFISGEANLPKKKNNFLFQNNEFLKKSELMNSKSSSRVKKLRSFQRNLDEADTAKQTENEEEVKSSLLDTQNLKVSKEAGVNNSNVKEQPETAYDFVKKLRSTKKRVDPELINGKFIQKNEQLDSKGFRILKNQVPDLKLYTRDEILELLVKNVLYSDDDLIVLNKPYNLVMHESKTTKDPCLSQYIEDLAVELDKKTHKPKLLTVHRLDKDTSGCLLLARNEISAQRLQSFFSQRKIVKTYWIVTTKVPNPSEGIIDMPISEGSVNGRARMVLHPDLPKDVPYKNHSKSGKRAVTHYQVIAESGSAALVEVKPETGIKHQIRVHFGFGLSCPILGDHKYSHLDKLAPQKLQSDLLQRLHVRQSKVRHIPMHIYARSIFIPQYRDGRNLFVMAPMPVHMSKNLQKLKFRKK